MTENQIFALVLLGLLIVLIVLILIAVKRRNDKEDEKPAAPRGEAEKPAPALDKEPVLMGSLAKSAAGAAKHGTAAARSRARGEMSMDEAYARAHGQWVCPFCETINDEMLGICQACGQPRS